MDTNEIYYFVFFMLAYAHWRGRSWNHCDILFSEEKWHVTSCDGVEGKKFTEKCDVINNYESKIKYANFQLSKIPLQIRLLAPVG